MIKKKIDIMIFIYSIIPFIVSHKFDLLDTFIIDIIMKETLCEISVNSYEPSIHFTF